VKRRDFIKLTASAGALAASGLGFSKMLSAKEPPGSIPQTESGQEVEASINTENGKVEVNPNILMRNSACLGCYSSCGNRVKINKTTGLAMQVTGNPYNPSGAQPHLAMNTPLLESYLSFSIYNDLGNDYRAALCARGNATLTAHHDPNRILVPLKRSGKRGEAKWQPITWEEAVQETVEGGTPFAHLGETNPIEGFRGIHDNDTPIDPANPELGPKSFQYVHFGGRGDGRTVIAGRFTGAFGTINNYGHGYS